MDDLITKYDAMEAVRNTPHFDAKRALIAPEQAMEAIGALDPLHGPSLLEELRPKGKWIEVDNGLVSGRCSLCGWEAVIMETDVCGMPFCPNCGAKIVKEENDK